MLPFRLCSKTIHLAANAFELHAQVGKEKLTPSEIVDGIKILYASLDDPYIYQWGCLDSNRRFVGYMTQVFSRKIEKHWLMAFICMNPKNAGAWNYSTNGLDALWKKAINAGNKYSCTNILYSIPSAWGKTHTRTIKTSRVWPDYHIHTFNEIKTGEQPTLLFDKFVFGQKTKTHDTLLRCAWKVTQPGLADLNIYRQPEIEATVS